MPSEVFNKDEFIELSEIASECRVKRIKDFVKLKLRTKKRLVTIKLDEESADAVLKDIRCEVVEV